MVSAAYSDAAGVRAVADRLAARGHLVLETPHFTACRGGGRTVLLHRFGERTVDEDVSTMVADELGPPGVLTSPAEYGDALFAIVASTCPDELVCARCGRLHLDHPGLWRHFCRNTLARLRPLLEVPDSPGPAPSHVEQLAAMYRWIAGHRRGESLLDVGTNLGLLPVILAERAPGASLVGCDVRPDAVAIAADLAAVTGAAGVRFQVADVLAPDFAATGRFDTVVAVHLLEHLTDGELPVALANLLRVTAGRLIVAVPYEEEVQPLYGHVQRCTPARLRAWGEWCVTSLGGGRSWCGDVCGGMLMVDVPPCAA